MGLLSNLRRNMDSLVSAIMAPAEDPRQTSGDAYQRQLELLEQIRQALAQVAQTRRQIQGSVSRLRSRISRDQERARTALAGGQEDLARQILQRRRLAFAEVEALERRLASLGREQARLARTEQQLAVRLDAFQTEREVGEAQASARARIGEVLEHVSNDLASLGLALDQARRDADIEEEYQSFDLLEGVLEATSPAGTPAPMSSRETDELVEAELAALRNELNQRPSRRQRAEPEAQAGV